MKRHKLKAAKRKPKNQTDMIDNVRDIWKNLDQEVIKKIHLTQWPEEFFIVLNWKEIE